jgi:hypothetical protein
MYLKSATGTMMFKNTFRSHVGLLQRKSEHMDTLEVFESVYKRADAI